MMTKEYVFYIELDGPLCGMTDGSVHTAPDPSVDDWDDALGEMAHDHVSSYIDVDEYEEENGCEIEAYGTAEAWDNKKHPQLICGTQFYADILDNMKQDDEGRWYVEK